MFASWERVASFFPFQKTHFFPCDMIEWRVKWDDGDDKKKYMKLKAIVKPTPDQKHAGAEGAKWSNFNSN